ncbi:MAG: hypothetical protein ACUVTX_11615, partial [Bacteroidales bacterium]
MKKSIFFSIIIAGIFLRLNNSYAQQTSEKEYKFTIKTNPLAALGGPFWVIVLPVTGEYKAYFETAVSQKTSFQVGASFLGPSVLINLDEISKEEGNELTGIKTGGYRIQGTFKYFISRDLNAPE